MNIEKINLKYKILNVLKIFILELIFTAISLFLFGIIMYIFQIDFKYASLLGTLTVALSVFATSFITAKKRGENGLLTGFLIGIITFILITLLALFTENREFTINSLFHLVIFSLSGAIGGILGVNKMSNKKYFK